MPTCRSTVPPLRSLAALTLVGASLAAGAATVNVSVIDSAGKPLPNAVVTLEPASGKAVFKPMPSREVGQKKKQFTPQVTVITVGTQLTFPNWDTVRHHVYSFSPVKTFELKLYPAGPSAPITFDKPGIATLGCNIHDVMAAWIVVVETPNFALTDAQGQAHVPSVAAGSYRLRVWHPGLPTEADTAQQTLTVAAADVDRPVRLPVTVNPIADAAP